MPTAHTPEVVPYIDRAENRLALSQGKAVHTPSGTVWRVEGIDGITCEFDTEESARAFWHEHGGSLVERVETSWTLAPNWLTRTAGGSRQQRQPE